MIHAVYENGVFRPTQPVSLPDKCEVSLEWHRKVPQAKSNSPNDNANDSGGTSSIEEELAEISEEVPEEVWDELPSDLTDHLDHYLYGTPKE